jgi:DNA-binding beta-propeller fold protein YncE
MKSLKKLVYVIIGAVLFMSLTSMGADVKIRAPEFPAGLTWLNSQPLKLSDLRGKVVMLDFWTYCCINCMHIIPDLHKLETKYKNELVIIGVHSAKFQNEQLTRNIKEAILRYDIEHPVINDNNFQIWGEYGARAWPTLVLIDPAGYIEAVSSGEGVYSTFDTTIADIIQDYDSRGQINRSPIKLELEKAEAPTSILSFPGKIAADEKSGRLFFTDSDHNRVIITSLDGQVQDVVGSGDMGLKDGDYSSAQFYRPQGLYFDPNKNVIYVADTDNHAIREINLQLRTVETLAGTGKQAGFLGRGGIGKNAALNSPWDLVMLGDKLYIAMAGAHQIWTLDIQTLETTPFAGSGREDIIDGSLSSAAFAQPSGITTDGKMLYIADSEVSGIREISLGPFGNVSTIIGKGLFDFGDIDGKYPKVRLQHPIGIAYHDNYLYVADTYNHKIKKVDPRTKEVTTLIGRGAPGMDDGPAAQAYLNEPNGLTFASGKIYITDTNNHLIRIYDLTSGLVSTLRLKGLEMLTAANSFRGEQQELPAMEISSGAKKLSLEIKLPKGTEFTKDAPFSIECKSDNTKVIDFKSVNISQPSEKLDIPITAMPGMTTLTIDLNVYYCSGNQGQCYFKDTRLKMPVSVTDKGNPVLLATYQIMH